MAEGYSYTGTGAGQLAIDLHNRKISAISTYFGAICDNIEICTNDISSSLVTCHDAGPNRTLIYSLNTINFEINAFFGDFYNYYNWDCLNNFGITYFLMGERSF